jgi:3-hydroxyisobutyrate dehydrogenase-like beta-hydroxyacid dehydrogenase
MSSLPKIGWIGAGRMGVLMAGFILKAGYAVVVYSRSATSRGKLVALGADEATSVAQCARDTQVVFSCISDDTALREVALGPQGVLINAKPNAVFIDTSTVSAEVSAEIAQEARKIGISYLRIPISGNAASARMGNVTALVSGPETVWNTVRPIVESFSTAQVYLGSGEEARIMKLVVNLLVYATAQAMAEALTLGRKAGLDWNLMLDTLGQSTLASPWLKAKVAQMKPRDFTPTMTARMILKDLDLMLDAARSNDVPLPVTALTRQLAQALVEEGYEEEDYMAAIKLAEKRAGLPADQIDFKP